MTHLRFTVLTRLRSLNASASGQPARSATSGASATPRGRQHEEGTAHYTLTHGYFLSSWWPAN